MAQGPVKPTTNAIVSDVPQSYIDGQIQSLSITANGRLRVSSVHADIERVWQNVQDNPWTTDNPWMMENPYV